MAPKEESGEIVVSKNTINVRDPYVDAVRIITAYDSASRKQADKYAEQVMDAQQGLIALLSNQLRARDNADADRLVELGRLRAEVAQLKSKVKKKSAKIAEYVEMEESTERMILEGVVGGLNAFAAREQGTRAPTRRQLVEALRQVPGVTKAKALEYLSGALALVEQWPDE